MKDRGFTLIEVSIVMVVMSILAMVALPSVKLAVKRRDEMELRRVLRNTREAIDRYWRDKDRVSPGGIDALKYPKSLQVLVDEKYLRVIPIDPMSGKREWRIISSTDEPDSEETNGDNVWDIKSLSEGVAIDGSKYSEW